MKLPKYIEYKIDLRTRLAEKFWELGLEIDDFCDKNNIEIDPSCSCSGVETICNPKETAEYIKDAIRNK